MKPLFQFLKKLIKKEAQKPFKVDVEPVQITMNKGWYEFDNGSQIGTKGSEWGIIVFDYEHEFGSRITLEKDCGSIPYAVVFGIYGLMFHTEFFELEEQAKSYILRQQKIIEEVLALDNIPEKERKTAWAEKFNELMDRLVEP